MTDRDFDLRLERVLRTDAERAVRAFDPVQLALDAEATVPATRRLEWRPAGWPVLRLVLISALLLLAVAATIWLGTVGAPRRPSLVEVAPTAVPSAPNAAPSAAPTVVPLNAELAGDWIAAAPDNLVIAGTVVTDPFVFSIERDGGRSFLPIGTREQMPAILSASGPDELEFVTGPGPVDPVSVGGQPLRACAAGDEGTYRVTRSPDGLLLTLAAVADFCPSRAAVIARTWVRYLGRGPRGGIGVVDAFDPLFAVELPHGSYALDRRPGNITFRPAPFDEFEFNAWKDPQGFNDPCDPLGAGRRPITNAADFVAYFRQLPGFTVDSVTGMQLGGRPATHLELHVTAGASCPDGPLAQWQPAELTDDLYWVSGPGDRHSVYLVDVGDTTLMFEVLGPEVYEAPIIPTIRVLPDGLPASP